VKKYVKNQTKKVAPEVKSVWTHDNEVQLSSLAQGFITSGPAVINGQAAHLRLGNEIKALSLHLKGILYNNSTQESYTRMIVLTHDGRMDPSTSLFRNSSNATVAGPASVVGLDAMYYPLNKVDFKVRVDKVFKISGSTTGAAGSNTRMFSQFIKFNGKRITYKGNTSGANVQDWFYTIIWINSDANDDTTTGTSMEMSQLQRFYFTDA
jgi:hypothetical protein